jgi:hypothetical protein
MKPSHIRTGSKDEAETYAKRPGHWTVGNLRQSIGWTEEPAIIEYAGRSFLLLPETTEFLPAIAVQADAKDGRRAVLEFASALAWSRVGSVAIEQWTGGNRLDRAGKSPKFGQMTAAKFHISYLPESSNKDQNLALALFHEGTGLLYIHTAYSFLSFYKIINLVCGGGNEQKAWINKRIPNIKHHRASGRLAELLKTGEDIGNYLYQSGRCAIAHAGDDRNPVVHPHDPDDERRLRADLPLIITLAEIAIEEIGIQTDQTVYREHRYELSGFEELLPAKLVEQLKAGKANEENGHLEFPDNVSLRMWSHPPYAPLEGMKPEAVVSAEKGVLIVRCRTKIEGVYADLVLDFPNYRLHAEIVGSAGRDDGSAEFIEERMEIERFYFEWNGNGCLEIWADGKCLGRCDAFIPTNVFLDFEAYEKGVAEMKAEASRRPRRPVAQPQQPIS